MPDACLRAAPQDLDSGIARSGLLLHLDVGQPSARRGACSRVPWPVPNWNFRVEGLLQVACRRQASQRAARSTFVGLVEPFGGDVPDLIQEVEQASRGKRDLGSASGCLTWQFVPLVPQPLGRPWRMAALHLRPDATALWGAPLALRVRWTGSCYELSAA